MGEGKSTIAASIAAALAQLGRDVVLISADLRFPRVHAFFGLGNDRGLGQVLTGEATLEEALCESPVPRLRVLPSGPVGGIQEPVELIQSDEMLDVIARCAESDFVIIDGSPILTVADSLVLATMVDAVLFVVDAQSGRRGAIVQSRYQLRQVDARVVGGVLNGVDGWRAARGGFGSYDYRRGFLYRILVSEWRRGRHPAVGSSEVRE
jgi:capsular exopolysaccharide synthesis family protein